jgi:hypothetical protein
MRRLGVTPGQVADVVANPETRDIDATGKPRCTGHINGVRVRIVMAVDRFDFVVSVHERRR